MTDVFINITQSAYVQGLTEPFRMLLYNGDADMACGFVEAEFFIENLVSLRGATVSLKGWGRSSDSDLQNCFLRILF